MGQSLFLGGLNYCSIIAFIDWRLATFMFNMRIRGAVKEIECGNIWNSSVASGIGVLRRNGGGRRDWKGRNMEFDTTNKRFSLVRQHVALHQPQGTVRRPPVPAGFANHCSAVWPKNVLGRKGRPRRFIV